MNAQDLRDRLFDWADHALEPVDGVTVIFARQPTPDQPFTEMPPRPFCSIAIGAPRISGEDGATPSEDDIAGLIVEHAGRRELTVRFRIFAVDDAQAGDLVEHLRRAMHRETARDLLGDLAIIREVGSIEAGAVRGGIWEARSQLDIGFAYTAFYTDEPGIIEQASFVGDVDEYEFTEEIDFTDEA